MAVVLQVVPEIWPFWWFQGGPPGQGQPTEDKALGSGSIGPSPGDLPPENINSYKERKQKSGMLTVNPFGANQAGLPPRHLLAPRA